MNGAADLHRQNINSPWLRAWPQSELQAVLSCPACGSTARNVLQDGLVDNVFFVAPGRWTLYQCKNCNSAYLDPCPNKASIDKAYTTYYTHATETDSRRDISDLGFMRFMRRVAANGYLNHRYGTQRIPASEFGAKLLSALPNLRQGLDAEFRYVIRPKPGQKLLDIGCGNGAFLRNASEAGWKAFGVDPDPKATAIASSKGFDVRRGGIETYSGERDCFDVITLNHVIEHVHQPEEVMRAAFRLLKPGGIIYIDTPNIESQGYKRFGANWRGIETPRHLVLFSRDGLSELLNRTGFNRLDFKRRSSVRKGMALSSLRMQHNYSPYNDHLKRLSFLQRLQILLPRSIKREEFLTVLAQKDVR